jgi:hypothetical protein
MKMLKAQLLAATVVAGGFPAIAQAQFAYPAAELRGVGATSIQNVLVQTLNCNGNPGDHSAGNTDNLNKLGANNGSLSSVAEGNFTQTNPTAVSPDFNCDRQEIQPRVEGKYVGTGSGTGRNFWALFANQLPGTTTSNINPFGTWNNVQFAFSDAPVSASNLATYDANAGTNQNGAGAPIQFPLYVLPVAIAYNPVYGQVRTANGVQNLTFAVKSSFVTTDADGNPTGGLRLTRNLYCKIFNGYVTNFNDRAFASTGTNSSLRDPQDDATRWKNDGAPIRLVGRLDNSGTTDIFTRHLAAACASQAGVAVNKFQKNAEALPYNVNSGPDLRSFRSDTRYFPTSSATPNTNTFAGTTQSLSGAVFVRASGGNPARIDTTQGAEQAGLFLVADGSGGVRDAINFQPEPANRVGAVELNGKVGYIGSDFVKPSANAQLFSAALQIGGTGTKYASPTADQGILAFGQTRYLPPQTTQVSGAYNANDQRTGPRRDGQSGTVPIDRANPLHWTSVLYSNPDETLAAPRLGYPITGTTQYLGYTCYADPATRAAMVEFLSLYTGDIKKDSDGNPVSPNLITGTRAAALGLLAQQNIAAMPTAWLNAISDTFLAKSRTAALAAKNLWIQDKLPTRTITTSKSNPTCTEGKGA